MVDANIKLTVYLDSNGTFIDYSKEMHDFIRDSVSTSITSSSGGFPSRLYIGYSKPINKVYFKFTTPNSLAGNTLTTEYWNGSTWTAVPYNQDDTKGFTRSGFIKFGLNKTNETAKSVNSNTLYWIRIGGAASTSTMTIDGISFLFADDHDLTQEVPEIADTNHLAGKTSHINTHVAVRDQIIQDLRNKDYYMTNPTTGLKEDLTVWDILDANQLRIAAIYLALSKIYFNFSDTPDDIYQIKSNSYYKRYEKAIQLTRVTLDEYSDGNIQTYETMKEFKTLRIQR